jgi:hypothetical protein
MPMNREVIMSKLSLSVLAAALASAATLLVSPTRAQDAIGPFISTVGTTIRENGTGRDWAYLLWTANSPTLLKGQAHAIYSKPGDANSAGTFTRIAIVSLQTEAITLAPLLGRAILLGEDTNSLHLDIDALFGNFVPQNLSLPEKLSAIVRGVLQEEKHYGRLVLLSRAHPSVAMALGYGHAELIGAGQTTFEVREFDRDTQTDGAVIGRVTVTAGAPLVLPPPGVPVEMLRDNARGHLNTQLRWGVPDDLRRMSLLQHGYNVWRVREDFAEARNWHTTPPTPLALASNSLATTAVRKINRLPLLVSKTFSLAQAADLSPAGDTNTFFVIDDNDRGRSNIVTTLDFTNGARFYYFVTARDVLGRDGMVSPGKEVQICNKLPPDAVDKVEVVNESVWLVSSNRQRLRVNWPQAANLPLAEQRIKAYWVYRWSSIGELRSKQGDAANNLIAIVNHVFGQTTNSYLDAGAGAPTPLNDLGKTFWYTVRAEDDGACAGNLSPHSAPAFGVLRDRTGPVEPTGLVQGICYDPKVEFLTRITNGTSASGPLDGSFQFTIMGGRGDRLIEWMEFRAEVRPTGSTNVVATYESSRMFFGSGSSGSLLAFPFDVPGDLSGYDMLVKATAGFADGESGVGGTYQPILPRLQKGDQRILLLFGADLQPQSKDDPCDRHYTVGPGDVLQPIELQIQPKAGSKELRVYRRVDDGPLDLIYQRPLTNLDLITLPDDALPHGGGRICYFASTLDEHGNASALTALGCIFTTESSAPPRPQLSPITSAGSEDAAQMVLSWFCPSVNVDRFEVGIAAVGDVISSNCAPGYLKFIPPPTSQPEMQPVPAPMAQVIGLPGLQMSLEFRRFLTPKPSADFGSGDRFGMPVDVQPGRRYVVYVKSIGKSGNRSERSNLESFYWQVTVPPLPEVPWPARPLPPVGNSFGMNFDALFLPACGSTNLPGVPVVRISALGRASRIDDCPLRLSDVLYPDTDPNTLLPTNSVGQVLFPVVLYRQQVPNSAFPTVSGDVVQVSPMMESIAWGVDGNESVILDPYVLLERGLVIGPSSFGMYLRDTQPIISGSRYRYFLVRFNHVGELAEVIPAANELEAP